MSLGESVISFKTLLKKALVDGSGSMRRGSVTPADFGQLEKLLGDPKRLKDHLVDMAAQKKLQALLLNKDPNEGLTLLHHACRAGHLESAFSLIQAGASVVETTANGTSALHYLAQLSEVERQPISIYNQLLHITLSSGAKIDAVNSNGETSLAIAAMAGNDAAASFLIHAGAGLNLVATDSRMAPLHFAISGKKPRVILQLIRAGADCQLYCKQGPPLLLAKEANLPEAVMKELEEAVADQNQQRKSKKHGVSIVKKVDSSVTHVDGTHSSDQLPPAIQGCFDFYRNEISSKSHSVFFLDVLFYTICLPHRSNAVSDGKDVIEGVIIDNMGFRKLIVFLEDLELYKSMPSIRDQLCHYLNSRGDLTNRRARGGAALAKLNSGIQAKVEWVPSKLPEITAKLLELEARLQPRRRLHVGVLYGNKTEKTEEQMMSNGTPSNKFNRFLSLLGERFEVSEHFPGSTMGGFHSQDDKGQTFVYTSWFGFEFVFHVASLLDPLRQRRFIGNDTVLIYFKEGAAPEEEFRGQVNAVSLVVQPCKSSGKDGKRDSMRIASQNDGASLLSPTTPRGRKKAVRNSPVRVSAFYRSTLGELNLELPDRELDLIAHKNTLRHYILAACINGHVHAIKSGAYAANTGKLYVQSISSLIEANNQCK